LSLNLQWNSLTEDGMRHMQSLLNFYNLSFFSLSLILSQNKLGDEGAKNLGKGLSQLKKLENLFLDVQNSGLSEIGLNDLIFALKNCVSLKSLTLWMDSDQQHTFIEDYINSMANLNYVSIMP
jgi:hypothetical protein